MSKETPTGIQPFDLDKLARGEAWAIVTTDEGKAVAGRLDVELMWVDSGPPAVPSKTAAATRKNRARRALREFWVSQYTAEGLTNAEIAQRLVDKGLMRADANKAGRRRVVAALRSTGRRRT